MHPPAGGTDVREGRVRGEHEFSIISFSESGAGLLLFLRCTYVCVRASVRPTSLPFLSPLDCLGLASQVRSLN